jgi:hypothetical protein
LLQCMVESTGSSRSNKQIKRNEKQGNVGNDNQSDPSFICGFACLRVAFFFYRSSQVRMIGC